MWHVRNVIQDASYMSHARIKTTVEFGGMDAVVHEHFGER